MAWNLYDVVHILVRWLHVLAGITWIGHLYFFNFVNVPLQAALEDAVKKGVNSKLMSRALWWFRWGAMLTFLAGLWLFTQVYMYTPGAGFGPSQYMMEQGGGISDRAIWIMIGMTLGFIMWFNVWFIIWPAQQKIFNPSTPPDTLPLIRRRAYLASRTNTYLSGPMLFGMLLPNHGGALTAFDLPTLLLVAAVALALIWHAIKFSPKVGTSF